LTCNTVNFVTIKGTITVVFHVVLPLDVGIGLITWKLALWLTYSVAFYYLSELRTVICVYINFLHSIHLTLEQLFLLMLRAGSRRVWVWGTPNNL